MSLLWQRQFLVPWLVFGGIILYLLAHFGLQLNYSNYLLYLVIAVGGYRLLSDSIRSLLTGSFALDYIAILAISAGIYTGNYLVAAIIVLMMSGGNALEEYAKDKAKHSLTALHDRLPNQVHVLDVRGQTQAQAINTVKPGSQILIRKGEVIPLDGELLSVAAEIDEASLTGEAEPVNKQSGDRLISGTVNLGEAIILLTTSSSDTSTYSHIVKLVEEAQGAKAPFVQLADQLSAGFTIVTLLIAYGAYLLSGDFERVLAVLVIATPCPLILATPIAMIGGMSAAADARIIFKKLAALEKLAQTKQLVLDKTGTITLGQPQLQNIEILTSELNQKQILRLVAGLERNSLHPLARAVLAKLQEQQLSPLTLTRVTESLGQGISGYAGSDHYRFTGQKLYRNRQLIARFTFADQLKSDSLQVIKQLQKHQIALHLLSGDSLARVQASLSQLPAGINFEANLSPTDKLAIIKQLQRQHQQVAMVGDGINDAPALAQADVGLVFAHQEHTAASQAADVVLLSGNFMGVWTALQIAWRTMRIAKQSMYLGVGLSILGMLVASFGYLPPLAGAFGQEIIDLAVIFNALRARKG